MLNLPEIATIDNPIWNIPKVVILNESVLLFLNVKLKSGCNVTKFQKYQKRDRLI